jgi:hypothetical protein
MLFDMLTDAVIFAKAIYERFGFFQFLLSPDIATYTVECFLCSPEDSIYDTS